MSQLNFMIDIDSVLTATEQSIHAIMKKVLNKDVPIQGWYQYELGGVYDVPDARIYEAFLAHEQDMLVNVPLYQGAQEFLYALRERGNVHIVTARGWSANGEQYTKEYFHKHDLEYDSLTVIASSKLKGQYARELKIDMAKDDHADHIYSIQKESVNTRAILRDQPWNQHAHDLERVDSFKAFLDIVDDVMYGYKGCSPA